MCIPRMQPICTERKKENATNINQLLKKILELVILTDENADEFRLENRSIK
jgi:hypothetical protein